MGAFLSNYPAASFDFYPYAGLQRPVTLFAVPERHIRDITVVTDIAERDGLVRVTVVQSGEGAAVAPGSAAPGAPGRRTYASPGLRPRPPSACRRRACGARKTRISTS